MKKFIMGLVVGGLLAVTVPVGATAIHEKLTATVRTDYTIELNGEKLNLSNHIVTINGSSYLPVREVSNALGANIEFNSGVIIMSTENVQTEIPKPAEAPVIVKAPKDPLQFEWDLYVGAKYTSIKESLVKEKEMLAVYQNSLARIEAGELEDNPALYERMIEVITSNINSFEKELSDIETKYPQAKGVN
jgi:hypothetical protein